MTLLDRISSETLPERRIPVLKTERLILRAPRIADAQAVAKLINDHRIAENLSRVPHPYALKDAETFIASVNRKDGEVAFLVALRDGTIVGGCGVGLLAGNDPEIGYWYGVPFWGRGYATEAARALIDFAFNDLGHERLEGGARVSNPASRRVLEKCGYVWTGVTLTRVRALGGVSVPCDRFRLDRERWTDQRAGCKADSNERTVL
jgi:RimJ/RimL family protein N-acetyltransferase